MANWNFKNLDAISAVCKSRSQDLGLPDASRKSFAEAFMLINGWKHSAESLTGEHVERAFHLMRAACQTTRICECQNLTGRQISFCPLLREDA